MSTQRAPWLPIVAIAMCVQTGRLAAQATSCESTTKPLAASAIERLQRLAARTDTAAARIRLAYRMPADLSGSEIVVVSTDSLCARAASLYFLDRDKDATVTSPVLMLRLRDVYYVTEPAWIEKPGDHPRIFSIVVDGSVSTILERFSSK